MAVLAVFSALSANAELVITYAGDPGSAVTPVTNASTFSFNSLSAGTQPTNVAWNNSEGEKLATFDKLSVQAATQYGGANNSNFAVNSTLRFGQVAATTITFEDPAAYFGLWWSAGDATNVLEFYRGGNLLFSFTTASLLNELAALPAYSGNPFAPYKGNNTGEKYAYINFFGQSGSTFDKIVITNIGDTGFEYDNLAVRTEQWDVDTEGDLPGVPFETITPIPEPGSLIALGGLIGSGAFLRSRRRK